MRTPPKSTYSTWRGTTVGMKPLSERDENYLESNTTHTKIVVVGMKPLSERDENQPVENTMDQLNNTSRNEATL